MSNVKGITEQNWILALFVRGDGERLLLGDGAYEFKDSQQHFAPNEISSTTVEVQGGDGILLGGQVRRAATQSFDGYVGDATFTKSAIEEARWKFINFFRTNIFYEVIYIFTNGKAIKRQRGFLVDAPSVQELYQIHPEYHVALNFEDVNYYNYLEDAEGNELYGQKVLVPAATSIVGGFVWDEVGLVWDETGAVNSGGTVGNTIVQNNSQKPIYPVWTIIGPAVEPELENLATGEKLKITASGIPPEFSDFAIGAGDRIVVDMARQTATLYYNYDVDGKKNATNILPYLEGDWLTLQVGRNELSYSAKNQNAADSILEWAEVVG